MSFRENRRINVVIQRAAGPASSRHDPPVTPHDAADRTTIPFHHFHNETFRPMKTIAPLLVCVSLVSAACTPAGEPMGEDTAMAQNAAPAQASDDLLAAREADYQAVFEQAQRQGFIAGGLRGAMLGALIDSERGAVIGAAFGAILGSGYAAISAEHLLQEREEFLNRQKIIENILDASRSATARSIDDADLVSRAVSEQTRIGAGMADTDDDRIGNAIATVRRAAEMRAVLIEELMHEAQLTPAQQDEVRAQITLQRQAVSVIRVQQQAWEARTNG